ncbi:AraC family transcriptional regulator [Chryseobacterium kwangjuense]|uniref:AraC family transcriptional regulator n=1 Tax=Chryseobacterium kwangjuense TaxID=267125 RepID=A0ABW9JZ13_9FLAO
MKKNIKNIRFDLKKAPFGCEVLELEDFFKRLATWTYFGKTERVHFFCVIVVTEGEGRHFVDFKEYHLEKGDILFVAPSQIQQYENSPYYKGYMLIFTEYFFRRQINELTLLSQSSIFDTTLPNALIKPDHETFSKMVQLLLFLQAEFSSPHGFSKEESLQKLTSLFLIYAEREKQRDSNSISNDHYLSQYYHFKQLLEQHFKRERSVEFYASLMAITPKTLCRITRSTIQKSAKEFIDSRVVMEIKRLLLFEKLSIKEIAYSLHFNEPTNLVKYFKKHTGETPTSYKG